MVIENMFDEDEVSRRELATTDYQVTRAMETLLPLIIKQLKNAGEDVSVAEVEHAKIDDKKRGEARARIRVAKAKKK